MLAAMVAKGSVLSSKTGTEDPLKDKKSNFTLFSQAEDRVTKMPSDALSRVGSDTTSNDNEAYTSRAARLVWDGAQATLNTAQQGASLSAQATVGVGKATVGVGKATFSTVRDGAEATFSTAQNVLEVGWGQVMKGTTSQLGGQSESVQSMRRMPPPNGEVAMSATSSISPSESVGPRRPAPDAARAEGTDKPGTGLDVPCMSGDCILLTSRALWALLTWPFAGKGHTSSRAEQ
mmetsp:Transcript_7418/g.13210  ORF Transcript_7418/g.13210 Transcript_7418/m.13210 type:complete len:234 (+) Transcript_7418:54-755(+)